MCFFVSKYLLHLGAISWLFFYRVVFQVPPGWHDPDFSEMKMLGVWDEQAEYVARQIVFLKVPNGSLRFYEFQHSSGFQMENSCSKFIVAVIFLRFRSSWINVWNLLTFVPSGSTKRKSQVTCWTQQWQGPIEAEVRNQPQFSSERHLKDGLDRAQLAQNLIQAGAKKAPDFEGSRLSNLAHGSPKNIMKISKSPGFLCLNLTDFPMIISPCRKRPSDAGLGIVPAEVPGQSGALWGHGSKGLETRSEAETQIFGGQWIMFSLRRESWFQTLAWKSQCGICRKCHEAPIDGYTTYYWTTLLPDMIRLSNATAYRKFWSHLQ